MIKITIVEDLPLIQEGLKLLINKVNDFEIVAEYLNGKEFIDNINAQQVDIVLMDIDMPVMDGITATKLALSYQPELKIIALTMHQDRKYYYEMVTAGAKGFVLKQETSKELEVAIRDVVNDINYFSPDLLRSVIIDMQGIEKEIIQEKRALLKLSEREIETLGYLCQGLTNKELSEKLFVGLRTVEALKSKLMEKTKTRNNAGLIIWAIKNKIVIV